MGLYTDLALESREMNPDLPGVREETMQTDRIFISRITVDNEVSAEKLGKAIGKYITLDSPSLADRDKRFGKEMSESVAAEIREMLKDIPDNATILIVGLGNRYITPDSLGPRVVERVYVTRHITQYMPDAIDGTLRAVCAVAPGVLGVTGVETLEVVRGLTDRLHPDVVIAIDSLASRRAARINTTIQITDTGISPGSGVGNTRAGLNKDALNTKVIAIGVPLVVYASTISQDTISLIADETGKHGDEEQLLKLAEKVINEHMGPMIVTPKDIDCIVEDMSEIIADGLNLAMHGEKYAELSDILV